MLLYGPSQKALVPQVYARTQPGDLDSSGSLLAGRNVDINLSGDLTNTGTIAGRQVLHLYDPTVPSSVQAWVNISTELAKNAVGEVKAVLGSQMRPQSIWETYELPALKSNPAVTKVIAIDPKTGNSTVIFDRTQK